jgi:hypothetical protein
MSVVKKVIVRIVSGDSRTCPLCDQSLEGFEESCNHLLQVHKLKCLHIGQETEDVNRGLQNTVGIFGRV